MRMIDAAVGVAAQLHWGQRRKYTEEPYVCHCLEVVSILASFGHTDDTILSAAVLHDVIEDCDVLPSDLIRIHGIDSTVVDLVQELTEPARTGNRATRKAEEAQRLATISPVAQTIKYADLISNTHSITVYDPDFAKVYLREKAAILEVMDKGDPTMLAYARTLTLVETMTLEKSV